MLQLRYWNEHLSYDGTNYLSKNRYNKLPLDSALIESVWIKDLLPRLEKRFSNCSEQAYIDLNKKELIYAFSVISRDLSDKIDSRRFNELVHNYDSLSILSFNESTKNEVLSKYDRCAFIMIGSVYDQRESDKWITSRKSTKKWEERLNTSVVTYDDGDIFPFYQICTGVFNFRTQQVEYLYRTESYSIDLKNEPQYRQLTAEELIEKIPK